MDLRVKNPAHQLLANAKHELRALARRVQANAMAAAWAENVRGFATVVFLFRRRIATIAVAVLAGLLFVHVMFGANGMIVYKQKRAEFESLQKRIAQEEKENEIYNQRIQGLKTDSKAIEKEAREQLRYARPGEYVYVPPTPVNPVPFNHSAKK